MEKPFHEYLPAIFTAALLLVVTTPLRAETVNSSCAAWEPRTTFQSADVTGDPYENHFNISFSFDDSCVQRAGIYAGTQLLREIPVHSARQLGGRDTYSVEIDAALEPELRLFTLDGRAVHEPIDVLDIRGM